MRSLLGKCLLKKYLLAAAALGLSGASQAHPVFYSNGWGVMLWNSPDKTEFYGAYTLTHRIATGIRYFGFREPGEYPKDNYTLGQLSLLLKRWNAPSSQGNIYATFAGGLRSFDDGAKKNEAAFLSEVQADWEDRRLYTLGKVSVMKSKSADAIYAAKTRVGVAPYLAEFTELNTWMILELEDTFEDGKNPSLTPYIRLFYNNFLTELGYSLDGKVKMNFMTHF